MEQYKREFIEFMIDNGIRRSGSSQERDSFALPDPFTTKTMLFFQGIIRTCDT